MERAAEDFERLLRGMGGALTSGFQFSTPKGGLRGFKGL